MQAPGPCTTRRQHAQSHCWTKTRCVKAAWRATRVQPLLSRSSCSRFLGLSDAGRCRGIGSQFRGPEHAPVRDTSNKPTKRYTKSRRAVQAISGRFSPESWAQAGHRPGQAASNGANTKGELHGGSLHVYMKPTLRLWHAIAPNSSARN